MQPHPTKKALEESLKNMLLKKPLDKITIRDITNDCGISRMAFYYHFHDIYDLIEWACLENTTALLNDRPFSADWQTELTQVFEAMMVNRPFVLNAAHSLERVRMEYFIHQLVSELLRRAVDEKSSAGAVDDPDKAFIIDFFTYSIGGVLLSWIEDGMDADYEDLVRRMSLLMQDAVCQALRRFEAAAQG